MRRAPSLRPLPVLLAALALAATSCAAGQDDDGDAGAGAGGTSSSATEAAWVSRAEQSAVAAALEEGTGARLTTLDVYSAAEYADAMDRQLATVFGDDVAGAGDEQASSECLQANREATAFEADSGARAVAGAGNAAGAESTATDGYMNVTVTDFPDEAAAQRSWELHSAARRACAGQDGWLGVRDAETAAWDGGDAVVYSKRVTGADGQALTVETTHVLDGARQHVLNRRTDDGSADRRASGIEILQDVAEALPAG